MARNLNKVMLIGNLVEKPELRLTEKGSNYCPFKVITDHDWKTKGGEDRHEAQLHYCIAWDKLGELCSILLEKGTLVYIEGRLQTHQTQENMERMEVVVREMIVLQRPRQKVEEEEVGKEVNNEPVDK